MLNEDQLDKLVNARTIERIQVDVVENSFSVVVWLRDSTRIWFVFAQPRQVSDFVQERLSKLPD